jgi:hypothetical protein
MRQRAIAAPEQGNSHGYDSWRVDFAALQGESVTPRRYRNMLKLGLRRYRNLKVRQLLLRHSPLRPSFYANRAIRLWRETRLKIYAKFPT